MSNLFRTTLEIEKQEQQIDHKSKTLLMGSCFSEHMAKKLAYYGFPSNNNPFGILYNAYSISKGLNYIASSQTIEEKDLIFQDDLWHSKWHHGHFSHPEKDHILKNCNEVLSKNQQELPDTKQLIITLGSAFVYELIETGEVVGNCHKIPANKFKKKRMTVEEVVEVLSEAITQVLKKAPLNITLTVSPVRHAKEGLAANSISKAILLLAVDALCQKFETVNYFPSYEMLVDDLRDYRFYEKDLIHPNQQAIDYVWEKFKASYINDSSEKIMQEIAAIKKAKAHKVLHPGTQKHLDFLNKLALKIKTFNEAHPDLDVFTE